jgi:hypothetical protein
VIAVVVGLLHFESGGGVVAGAQGAEGAGEGEELVEGRV